MPGAWQPAIKRILATRSDQAGFRLVIAALIAGCYGTLLTWQTVTGWLAIYAVLQVIELGCFSGPRPLFRAIGRTATITALVLLSVNSLVFGFLSIDGVVHLGAWGCASAAYLLAGCMLNTVVTTMECRPAFYASLVPFILYLILLALVPLSFADPPSLYLVAGMCVGAVLLTVSSLRIWSEWTASKRAENHAVAQDIAQRAANEDRLFRMAHSDGLTGLANRTVLHAHLAELATTAGTAALLMIDLDGFKYVNDTLGHSAGDHVLREVAARLLASARATDLTVRLGGDEFAVLMPAVGDPETAVDLAERVIAAVSQPVMLDGQTINIGASVGVAIHPRDGANAEKLFANADLALYQAKGEGRHCARYYNERLRAEARSKMSRDSEFLHAMDHGEFELFYQPQIGLFDGRIVGAEALLRWRHPKHGLLSPASFLPALESGRLAAAMGDWVLQTACAQAATWRRDFAPDFRISVNLFGAQFRAGSLAKKVLDVLACEQLEPFALELEITENVILRHEDDVVTPLRTLRDHGVGIAFDDYGTGYASLSLLKRYPLSRLKIDQSFTQAVCNSPADAAIVNAITSMASAFNLAVIAEGVETQAQADLLRRFGCEEAQGYHFGHPVSAPDFATAHFAPAAGQGRQVKERLVECAIPPDPRHLYEASTAASS